MRIVVFSDSHGITAAMEAAITQQKEAKLFIHLGDGVEEFKRIMSKYPNKEYWCIRGNCDYSATEESTVYSWIKDVKLMMTHGHHWQVKYDLDELKLGAREKESRIALYGHTHIAYTGYEDGLYIMNPGSISCPKDYSYPSYGTIDINGKNIVCNIVRMENYRGY